MDIWKHGRYLDFWSVVHVLSGVCLALACYGLGYSFLASAFISLILLCAWEFFEWFIGIIEPSPNVASDIIVGSIGFLFVSYWHYALGYPFDIKIFSGFLAATGCLALWGFLDFFFRGYR